MAEGSGGDEATEDMAIALMQALCAEGALSLARAAKDLNIRRSQLERLLALLGHTDGFGGLGYVRQEEHQGRIMVTLTAKGRELCTQIPIGTG
ncbi:hypothetical protein [Acidiferrobacter thiooxydans]|nr:hypothetical protein [Acidiferrobacter thiooxydans]UEO00821.1 hypothetical protein A9R16_005320 [Acidiferrobacter thiooxydans]